MNKYKRLSLRKDEKNLQVMTLSEHSSMHQKIRPVKEETKIKLSKALNT